MRRVWIFVQGHFRAHRTRSPLAFACWLSMEGLMMSFLAGLVAVTAFGGMREDITNLTYAEAFLLLVVVAPLSETLVFQMLPIALARWWRITFSWQIVVSTLLFAAAHFPAGIGSGVCAGVFGGFYFAFGYAHWAARSHWTAYWTTTLQHLLRNLVSFGLIAAAGGLVSHDATLDMNASSGGGIGVWSFTSRGDGTVQFALVFPGSPNEGRTIYPLTSDGSIRRNFQMDFASRRRNMTYSSASRTLTVDEHSFDLAHGNTIVFTVEGDHYTTRQLHITFDLIKLRGEPFHVLTTICAMMKSQEQQPAEPATVIEENAP